MSQKIRVTLPQDFHPSENSEGKKLYSLEICFNNTTVKTSVESKDYQGAIKKMMTSLQGKFAEILELVGKKNEKKTEVESSPDENDDENIIH